MAVVIVTGTSTGIGLATALHFARAGHDVSERVLAPFVRRACRVTANDGVGAYRVVRVDNGEGPEPAPGQFYMLAAAERWGAGEDERPYLPRAFSYLRRVDGELHFMLEDVGPGTERLCALRPGEEMWVLGPLGEPFREPSKRPVLCGGGVGIAPLAALQDALGEATVLLGFRDAEHAPGAALMRDAEVATDDGSAGHHGRVTELLERELSDEAFFPVYEALEALGLPLYLHPVFVIGEERLKKFYLTNLLGNPFESAIAAAHLIFGGVLDRFPRLEVVLPHAGGAFPWLVWRLHRGWEKRQDLKHIAHGPSEYLRRFYYDTVGYSDDVLDYLVRVVGADRILMGSDYCFPIAHEKPVEIVTRHPALSDAHKQAIVEGNARRLLKLGEAR